MAIKSYEEYSFKLDQIEGLVDLGSLGRKSERTKCVFVFCVDSLNARNAWRQPLAYFLPGKCMKAEEIIILLKECLDKLSETGADVQLITCDQGTCNQSAYAQLGINPENPFFIYNGEKYNASFDFPHLIKRLTSFLRTHRNLYCDGKVIASYSDFEITWTIDNATKGGSNLLSHITEAHIRPNSFESMNVKRAFQIFSHTFAATIKTACHEKELNTITWQATADFAERLNNVIDACNAYSLKISFGGKRPLSSKNPDIENLLIDFVEWCSRWSKTPENISQIPCFRDFVLTVRAILATFKNLSSQYKGFELATGDKEYDEPESELLTEDINIFLKECDIEEIESVNLFDSSYDENAIVYFAGFVARRSIAKSNCDHCRNDMMETPMDKSSANEKYIEFREYANEDQDAPTVTKLVHPTTLFTNITKIQLMTFNRTWEYYWASTQILDKIMTESIYATKKKHPEWLDKNGKCYDHRIQALKYMITIKLYSRTRYNNRAAKIPVHIPNSKSNSKVKKFLNK